MRIEKAAPALASFIDDSDWSLMDSVLIALGKINGSVAVEAVRTVWNTVAIQSDARWFLTELSEATLLLESTGLVLPVKNALQSHSPVVRVQAAIVLGRLVELNCLSPDELVAALEPLKDDEEEVTGQEYFIITRWKNFFDKDLKKPDKMSNIIAKIINRIKA